MSGPSQGSPVGLSLWKANDQETRSACSDFDIRQKLSYVTPVERNVSAIR